LGEKRETRLPEEQHARAEYSGSVSDKNVETLKAAYVALNAGDLEAALRAAAEDFVIERAGPDPRIRGKDDVRAFVAPDAFSEQTFEPLEFQNNGDLVFVWLVIRATGAGSSISLQQETAHVWEFKDGQAVSLTVSFDRGEALKAAGLSE